MLTHLSMKARSANWGSSLEILLNCGLVGMTIEASPFRKATSRARSSLMLLKRRLASGDLGPQ